MDNTLNNNQLLAISPVLCLKLMHPIENSHDHSISVRNHLNQNKC